MPLTAEANRDRMAARRAERPPPPPKTGRAFVPWAKEHYVVRRTRARVEAWKPVRYLTDLARVLTATDHPHSAALWKGSQLGFTHLACAIYAWEILEQDNRVLVVMPSDIEARRYHRKKIAPLYQRIPALQALCAANADRQAVRGIQRVFDTGAEGETTGGGVADRYRSASVDVQVLDELDGYPADLDEGDPWTLSQRAVQNSGGIVLAGSTPTSARGDSQIVAAFGHADLQLVFVVRCPVCAEYDDLAWERVRFAAEGSIAQRAETAAHACSRCGAEWRHERLARAIERGRWQEAALPAPKDKQPHFPLPVWDGAHVKTGRLRDASGRPLPWPRHVAFALNGLYSIWATWPEYVARWLRAQGDARRLRAFTEQVLARPFVDKQGESEFHSGVIAEHTIPPADIPDDHRLCVCSVDVQDGWLSVHLFLFGPNEAAVLAGRTEFNGEIDSTDGSAWQAFRHWLKSRPHVHGRPVRILVVDTGFQSDATVRAVRRIAGVLVYCIKGAGGWDRPAYRRSKTVVSGVAQRLYILGVDSLKLTVAQRFASGRMRLADDVPPDVAGELAGERLKWTLERGRRKRRWIQDAERVEALDCAVYALAAVRIANVADIPALPLVGHAPRWRRRTVAERLAATGHRVR